MSDETFNDNGQNSNEEPPKSRMSLNNIARQATGGNKTAGAVIAICMVVIGILIFAAPYAMGIGIGYFVTAGFIVYGIFEIIAYVRTPAASSTPLTTSASSSALLPRTKAANSSPPTR